MMALHDWKFCVNCFAMFFHGFAVNGVCPAGGPHAPLGFTFLLNHEEPETANQQRNWRFCDKCFVMYFDGFPGFGVCTTGNGHHPAGFNFSLPHDVPTSDSAQKDWRFCNKCFTMFFDGFAEGARLEAITSRRALILSCSITNSVPRETA